MSRRFRSTEYDLQKHIITGKRGPQSGQGIVQDVDRASLNRDDPTEFTAPDGSFGSSSIEQITSAYMSEAAGLSNVPSGDAIDLGAFSTLEQVDRQTSSGDDRGAVSGNRFKTR